MLLHQSPRKVSVVLFISLLYSTLPVSSQPVFDSFIEKLLKRHPQRFEHILKNREDYDIQILYTKIDRDRHGLPYFTTYRYRVDPERYFYPASTIKLAAAALALEKINNLNIAGLTRDTPMLILADRPSQTEALTDTTSENDLPSIAHYIRKIFLASDNDAYNRLYEFLGQEYFNETMRSKGYTNFRATHRLDTPVTYEENKYTNPVRFVKNSTVIYEQQGRFSPKDYAAAAPILRGKGHIKDGVLVETPMDFREKNAFGLHEQHRFLQNIMFPERVPDEQKLNLKADDLRFLYQYMSQLPVETEYPKHYREILDDASVKYLLFGKTHRRIPRQIRSYNKTGEAYGYLLDNAYIADFEMGVEFLLSAVIYCNSDQILNDNQYDYEAVGYQFMADLGKTVLEYELSRKRRGRPDLEKFEVEYDK